MFDLLFQLSIVFLIIMFTKNIMDMKKYNEESICSPAVTHRLIVAVPIECLVSRSP